MTVLMAELITGTEKPIGIGLAGATRCLIRVQNGDIRRAVLKRGSELDIACEVYCATLMKAWGIPVPDPFLLSEGGKLLFASADEKYPNLQQYLTGLQNPSDAAKKAIIDRAMRLVCSLPSAPAVVASDEALSNPDRNLGNVLWDGEQEKWIDHERCLGNGKGCRDRNVLCEIACALGAQTSMASAAKAASMVFSRKAPKETEEAINKLLLSPIICHKDVSKRISSLNSRIDSRLAVSTGAAAP